MSSDRRGTKKQVSDRQNNYSKEVNIGMLESPSFQSLTSAAKSICIRLFIENGYAAHKNRKNDQGRPHFKWSAGDSKSIGISGRNHFKAIELLKERGFIAVDRPGGMLGANGSANYFILVSDWKRKVPPRKEVSPALLSKLAVGRATALRIKKRGCTPLVTEVVELQPVKKSSVVRKTIKKPSRKIPLNVGSLVESKSDTPLQPGQYVYYKRPGDKRAKKAELLELQTDVWTVRGARTGNDIKRPILTISAEHVYTVDQVKRMK